MLRIGKNSTPRFDHFTVNILIHPFVRRRKKWKQHYHEVEKYAMRVYRSMTTQMKSVKRCARQAVNARAILCPDKHVYVNSLRFLPRYTQK